jgi:uncharacterized protein YacL
LNATLLTNDYNLNKVASFQEVEVLNINDLAQAIRPTYLPGDEMDLKILKEGKGSFPQGVGYLNDGTMVVVEEETGLPGRGAGGGGGHRRPANLCWADDFARPKTSVVTS